MNKNNFDMNSTHMYIYFFIIRVRQPIRYGKVITLCKIYKIPEPEKNPHEKNMNVSIGDL